MKTPLKPISLTLLCLSLCSCFGVIFDAVGPKPEYTGPRPPRAIPQEQAGSAKWLQRDPYELPASSEMNKKPLKYAEDGLPYGIESPYRNCVHSPYTPFPRLDTTGMKSGQIVYDPFAKKAFHLP